MQRRIEQPDADRMTLHDLEELHEIGALHRQQPRQSRRPVGRAVGKDHLAHHHEPVVGEEHVLGPAEADALRLELPRDERIGGRVGIGAHADVAHLVGPGEELAEAAVERGREHGRLARERLARRAVHGDEVALAEDAPVGRHETALARIEPDLGGAHDARQAEAPRDHGGMARDAAALGQHARRAVHAADILGRGLAPDEDAGLAARGRGLRRLRGEDDPAHRRPGAGRNAAGEAVAPPARIDLRMQKLGERARLDPEERLGAGDDLIVGQRHRDAEPRPRGALHLHRVEHRQVAVLDGEFDLHLLAQAGAADRAVAAEGREDLGRALLERGTARILREIERLGLAVPGARAVEEAPRHLRDAGGGIDELDHARARDPLPQILRHLLHDEAEPRLGGGALRLPEEPGGRSLPGPRHRAQHFGELLCGILREGLVHLLGPGMERRAERLGGGAAGLEHLGIEAGHMDRIALDEAEIDRVGRLPRHGCARAPRGGPRSCRC